MGPRLRVSRRHSSGSPSARSLRSRTAQLARAGTGLLLALGLAGTLEPLVQTATAGPAAADNPNLISNGSFENPTVPVAGFTTFCSPQYSGSCNSGTIPNWTVGNSSIDVVNTGYFQAEEGVQSVDLEGSPGPGSVSQTVDTMTGATYTLSWYGAANPDCGKNTYTMDVYWNGTLVDSPSFSTATTASMGWVQEEISVPGPTGTATTSTVEFASPASPIGLDCGATLDNVSLIPSQGTVTTSLSTSAPTVAGVETVPASAVPASGVDGSSGNSGDAASAPLSSIPLSSIGLAASPLSSIPLSSIPLSSIALQGSGVPPGLATAQQALESALLSDIGITYPAGCVASPSSSAPPCTGWAGVLAGTPYAGVPLESVTLADVLTNRTAGSRFDSVDLGALDLASSPLSSIPLSSIELGSTPLSSIGLGGAAAGSAALTAWCNVINCGEFGIYPGNPSSAAGVTLLSLALAGVPLSSIPLSSIPLSSIPLSSIPLSSIPLSSISLASNPLSSIPLSSISLASNPLSSIPLSSIPLSSIPLSSIPLSSIPLSSIGLICPTSSSGCTGTNETLGQAYVAGAILATATLADLSSFNGTTVGELLTGDTTSAAGYPALTLADLLTGSDTSELTLGDLVLLTEPPATYPWSSVSLSGLPLATDETAGGTLTYTANLDVSGAATTVQVSLNLPPTFAYVAGSATLDASPVSDPTGSPLDWTLSLGVGNHVLQFEANAGIGLGSAVTTVTTSVAGDGASSSATVEVTDGEAPAVNNQGTALPLVAGTPPTTQGNLNIGYLTSPGDLNDWSVAVSQGEELSLALSNLPARYDLELFGPGAQQLQGSPNQNLSGVTDTLPSLTPNGTTEATPGSQDIPVKPPAGDQLDAISNNPDGQAQYIQTAPLAAGTYIVQVSGYNGAFSSQPYLLRANLLGGATAPSCPGGISYLSSLASTAATTPTIPTGANTLFLVDTQRLTAAFGASSESTIVSDLGQVASDPTAGVNGAVIPVDAYATVQSAYAAWNSNPCSVGAANNVVAAIAAVVDQLRADHPSVQNLVIVGADDQIPFARLADGATQSNERDYGASSFAGENNPEADALSLGYYFSDDPYVAGQPLGVGSATLYTPQLAVGRLVESAGEIEGALTRFVSSNGNLNATASLTTGYSFLTSGASAVAANLAVDGLSAATLINESWAESDLDTALAGSPTPGIDSINAHFDYSRALPAVDNADNTTANLFTTADVRTPSPSTSYAGRLLFSMGCHAGLDVDDAEVSTSDVTTPVDDWAKTFADSGALWVANTGYGYADTDTIAYSARLMAEFAANLNGSLTIGEALTEAKQQYAAGDAILSPYDLKAIMESTFYGLPMYNLNKPPTPVAPPAGPSTTVVNATTGLTVSSPVVATLGLGTGAGQLGIQTTANGSYYQVNETTSNNSGTQETEYRPIEPLYTFPGTEQGLSPHGALVTGLGSTDVTSFTPAYSMPATGSADATPPAIGDAAFPGTLQRVATYGTFTNSGTGQGAQLDLVAGQYFPNAKSPGSGTQRLFTSMTAQVYYLSSTSQYADDYTPPTIDSSQASSSENAVNFTVQVTPSNAPVTNALVLYTDGQTPGTWTALPLSSSDGQNWSGTGPDTSSGQVQYFVEALDAAGNVAVSNNEGSDFNGAPQPAISITLSGSGPVNGYYTGPVTANIAAPADSTYVLDGSAPTSVPSSGSVTISNSGGHTLTVTDGNGHTATQAFAISTNQTSTTLVSSTGTAVVGQNVTFTATVAALSSGAGSPGGNVEFFDGTTPIAACGGTTGVALVSGGVPCVVNYGSPGTHQIIAGYLGNANFATSSSGSTGLTVNPRSASVTSFTVTPNRVAYGAEANLVFSATVTAGDNPAFPAGDMVTITNGATTICTITLSPGSSNSGSGWCSPASATLFPVGSYSGITATFNGNGADPNFLAVAPSTTTLTVSPGTPVVSWPTPAAITFGTSLGSTQLDATASVAGSFTYSPPAGTVLQPGTQKLSVTFTPKDTTDYTSVSTSTTISVGFTRACITTTLSGSLSVAKGQAICISSGGKVTGSVAVASGGALWLSSGTIGGSLSSTGALALSLCGTKVTGSVSVSGSGGPVMLGGPSCAGDTVGGSLAMSANTGGMSFTDNHVTGSLSISNNSGGETISGNSVTGSASVSSNINGVTFTNNTVGGSLAITNNTGGFTYSGNTVGGSVVNTGNH